MKKIKISEEQLTKVLKNILEQETADDEVLRVLDQANMINTDNDIYDAEDDIEGIEDELEKLLSPEEIVALQQDQIEQLQDRVQYVEELNADVLEFTSFLMGDLEKSPELDLKKSKQKLRALETRAGREIFWLKSRRL
jgi:long-subunit acyl-CoA synthetase (AMP-forming)